MFVTSCIFHETNEKFINWQKKIRTRMFVTSCIFHELNEKSINWQKKIRTLSWERVKLSH